MKLKRPEPQSKALLQPHEIDRHALAAQINLAAQQHHAHGKAVIVCLDTARFRFTQARAHPLCDKSLEIAFSTTAALATEPTGARSGLANPQGAPAGQRACGRAGLCLHAGCRCRAPDRGHRAGIATLIH